MSKPHNTEPLANAALARALRSRNPDWNNETVHVEQTNVIYQGTAKRPDILITAGMNQSVIVETEFAPANTVDQDALDRLGVRLESTEEEIEGVLAVILPKDLKTGDLDAIDQAGFRYVTHSLAPGGEKIRWPANGWIEGGIDELADAIEHLSFSNRRLAIGTELLERVVQSAAGLLAKHSAESPLAKIAEDLHQAPGEQTERMAAAICVSAFVFHAAIEEQKGIPPVPLAGHIDKAGLLDTWDSILAINYWPIFSIARDIVRELPIKAVPPVMKRIANSVSELAQMGATSYHDLTGRMFQTLITDRKFLATFYTLPESACLLAEMAVERLDVDWSNRAAIEGLRIADFACGTGALLSAAQRAMYRRYRRTGGDDKDLHRALMERVLTGLDIMPAATHLTCSMLSSAYPGLSYGESQIYTMPYGIEGGRAHIGSLDLLDSEHSFSLFATGESLAGTEEDRRTEHSVTINDKSCDLVIMNPPFTRPGNHESPDQDGVPVPSFAGFGKSHNEQRAMSGKLNKLRLDFGHGNAGLASNFMDLGHRKLKDGGVLALVIPFAFMRGKGWARARAVLADNYSPIHVVSIASAGQTKRSFSADTGMAESLIVAVKKRGDSSVAMFSNLRSRPASLLESAQNARRTTNESVKGVLLDAGGAGALSPDVCHAAQNVQEGRLLLPRQSAPITIPVTRLGDIADRGPHDRDISGAAPRGPFSVRSIHPDEIPTYPALWAHSASRERRLVVQPDSCGDVRADSKARAIKLWNRAASRLHANRDFQLNSQSLAMCLTPEESLGGRAWPNVISRKSRYEIPLLLWCNSTLGLLMHWWKGTRQQSGRANMTITAIPDLPVLDPRELSADQLDHCESIFDNLEDCEFLPANEAYRDEARKDLDRLLLFGITSVLQLDSGIEESLDLLRDQWCAEPSVHGGKGTRIKPRSSLS